MSDTTRQSDATSAPIDATARILGVSVRTVQRRLKAGELAAIERDGRRLVLLPDTTTKGATVDATPRQIDATERDTGSELVAQLRSENQFLRGVIEQLQRDGAEVRAALREVTRAMKSLPAPATDTGQNHGAAVLSPTMPEVAQRGANTRETGEASYGDIADELEF